LFSVEIAGEDCPRRSDKALSIYRLANYSADPPCPSQDLTIGKVFNSEHTQSCIKGSAPNFTLGCRPTDSSKMSGPPTTSIEVPRTISVSTNVASVWRCNPWEGVGGHRAAGLRPKDQGQSISRWAPSIPPVPTSNKMRNSILQVSTYLTKHVCTRLRR